MEVDVFGKDGKEGATMVRRETERGVKEGEKGVVEKGEETVVEEKEEREEEDDKGVWNGLGVAF